MKNLPHRNQSGQSRLGRRALLALTVGSLLTPAALPLHAGSMPSNLDQPGAEQAATRNLPAASHTSYLRPRIQVAILLDTSNSMDGLIDQTRNQLWQVVNEFASATRNGVTPVLEIALFEYGNDNNKPSVGYVRQLNGFTRELDQVSEGLFSLTTNGGNEYCGFAIRSAIEQLQWSQSDADIKTIFIAGNEPFTQGPVNFHDALRLARQGGISVNTIHAGGHETGIQEGWQAAAVLAGGDYMSIDTNQQIVHIAAPQDERIAELNARLNQTYLPYGDSGKEKHDRQVAQDEASSVISFALLSKRAASKSSAYYNNSGWDLVDALEQAEAPEAVLQDIEDDALPAPMVGLSSAEKLEYVRHKAAERAEIKREIVELSRQRDVYVAAKKAEQAAAAPSISDALTAAVKRQAEMKNFVFDE